MAVGGKVKGITIEFNGDTTKLGKAMKKINDDAKGVDKALKDVNRTLKFNPKNTELLAQKQTLLKQKVEQTKDKLEALKRAEETMNANGVDKNSQEFMELRREIIKTESQLEHYQKEVNKLNNVNLTALGNQFKDVGDKMKTVGEGMTKYVTVPIVAAGGASIAAWKEVDDALDTVIEKTGATGAAAEDLENIVKDIATTIPTDFQTAGEAVGEVNTRFGLTGDELEALSTKFIEFATLNDTDVSSSIDNVQKALSAFGLGAEYAGPLLDRLNLTGQQTGVSMDSLTAGLIQNGTAFQELGLSVDQAVILMGQMETSGANSETVMQGLRKALKNAAEEGKPLDQALAELQDTILNGTDSMDGLTASYELFGKSGDQIYGAVKNGTLDFSDLAIAAEDAGGSVENTFNETLDPMDKFQTTLNELKELGAEVGGTLLESLQPVIEKIASAIQKVAQWWSGLSPMAQKAILIAAGIAAAAGPIIMILGGIIGAIGNMIILLPIITAEIAASEVALLPIIAVILAIVAAVIAIIAIVNHWGEICEWFKGVWGNFTAVIKAVWEQTSEYLKAAWEALKAVAQVVWEALKASIITPIMIIWSTIQTVWNAIKTFLQNAWNGIKTIAQTLWNGIKTVIINPIQTAWNTIRNVINTMRSTISSVFNAIKSIASNVWNGIKNAITQPIETAKNTVKGIIDRIKGFFPLSIGKIFSNLKLPHFNWHWKQLVGNIKLPVFDGISWYAKGGIFDSPTLAGIGEAGPEAVVPLDKFWAKMDKIADAASGGGDQIQIIVNAAPGMDVNALANAVQDRLVRLQKQRDKAWA